MNVGFFYRFAPKTSSAHYGDPFHANLKIRKSQNGSINFLVRKNEFLKMALYPAFWFVDDEPESVQTGLN